MSDDKDDVGLETGIEGLLADDNYQGKPVFDVGKREFFNNMRQDRNRDRISSDKPNQFMRGTNYRKPFMIRFTDANNGKKYLSKIK